MFVAIFSNKLFSSLHYSQVFFTRSWDIWNGENAYRRRKRDRRENGPPELSHAMRNTANSRLTISRRSAGPIGLKSLNDYIMALPDPR